MSQQTITAANEIGSTMHEAHAWIFLEKTSKKSLPALLSAVFPVIHWPILKAAGGHHMDGEMMSGPGMMVVMVVIFAIVIYGIWQLLKKDNPMDRKEKTAFEILDEAYAKSEIDREQYFQRRNDLASKGAPPP